MKHRLSTILLFSITLLAACASSGKTISTPTQLQPTAALDLNTAAATEGSQIGITVIPSTTWSKTPKLSTETPKPSSTPIINQLTKTTNPDTQLTEQAYFRTSTQIASFPANCDLFNFNDVSFSPHGIWMAIHCNYENNQTLVITNKEGKQWVLQFKDYIPAEFIKDGYTPMGGLHPAHWTSNDVYLYFSSHINYSGGGNCFYGFNVSGLFRINVNTGAVSTVLPATISSYGPNGYMVAFSPGGGKLAYISGGKRAGEADHLAIHDFRTGNEITFNPGETSSGYPTWSPDGSQLAFSTCGPSNNFATVVKSSIKIFSVDTHEMKTIIEVERNFLSIDKTEESQKLKIVNTDYQTGKYNYFYFDWPTGRLVTSTPTS